MNMNMNMNMDMKDNTERMGFSKQMADVERRWKRLQQTAMVVALVIETSFKTRPALS